MTDLPTTSTVNRETLQEQIQRTKERLAELRREKKLADLTRARELRKLQGIPEKSHHKTPAPATEASDSDYVFGAANIGKELGQTAGQVYYFQQRGAYVDVNGDPAVVKLGPRTLMGYRSRLRNLRPPTE
jgi:hypothetical protein